MISPIGLQTCLSVAARAPATGCQEILKKLVVLSNISDLASLEQGLQTETRWHWEILGNRRHVTVQTLNVSFCSTTQPLPKALAAVSLESTFSMKGHGLWKSNILHRVCFQADQMKTKQITFLTFFYTYSWYIRLCLLSLASMRLSLLVIISTWEDVNFLHKVEMHLVYIFTSTAFQF